MVIPPLFTTGLSSKYQNFIFCFAVVLLLPLAGCAVSHMMLSILPVSQIDLLLLLLWSLSLAVAVTINAS